MLSPQNMSLLLSLLGIVVLLACLVLIGLKRVPALSAPQKLKGFGLDLNVSVVSLLVLVGLVLALSSTFLQIKNYDNQLSAAERRAQGLEVALAQARKMNVSARLTFEGVTQVEELNLQDLYGRYFIDNPDSEAHWEDAKLNPSVFGLELILTLEDITPKSRIEVIEVTDRNPEHPRKWKIENVGYVLTPSYKLHRE